MLKALCGLFLVMTVSLVQAECIVAGVEHEQEFLERVERIKALEEYKDNEKYLSEPPVSGETMVFEGEPFEEETSGGSRCYWSVVVYNIYPRRSSSLWNTFYVHADGSILVSPGGKSMTLEQWRSRIAEIRRDHPSPDLQYPPEFGPEKEGN